MTTESHYNYWAIAVVPKHTPFGITIGHYLGRKMDIVIPASEKYEHCSAGHPCYDFNKYGKCKRAFRTCKRNHNVIVPKEFWPHVFKRVIESRKHSERVFKLAIEGK